MSSIRSTVLLCAAFITIVLVMFVISVTRTPQLSEQELRAAGYFCCPSLVRWPSSTYKTRPVLPIGQNR